MKEERLQEIKDSVEFQYTLAKAKGFDNALLFTNEEEELIEEIERLNEQRQKVIDYIKHNISYYYDEDLDEHITQYEVDGVEILKIVGEIE